MIQKVHSSVLLIGLHFNQNIDMGVDWAPNLEEGEQRLQKANYSVIAFSGRQNELSQLNNFVKLLRQQTPEAKIIIFNESLKWNDLCQVINSCQPFALINESKSEISHLELWLRRALEEYHQAQQDRDLSQLILRQNQQLKRTKNQLKSKLRKQRRYLTSAHEKLNQTNIHAQALQTALLTIHRAKSLGEMENCLSIDLKEYLQLNWTKILFFSQSNLLEPKLKNHLGEIRVFRAPIFSDDSSVGDLCFARSQSLPEFSSREINFLIK